MDRLLSINNNDENNEERLVSRRLNAETAVEGAL